MIKLTTARSLRVRYLIGLSAIALLVTTSFLTMQHVVSKQRNFAQIVNLAGQQRGLVNRLAYFASQMATTEHQADFDQARAQVGRTINRIEDNHRLLREGSPEAGIPKVTSPILTTIYEDPMLGVDKALASFLKRARRVYATEMEDLTANSAAYIFLNVYGPYALEPMLDAAVDEYQRIGRESILRIERFELGIWLAALLTLLLELILIFRPLEKRVTESIGSLQGAVAQLEETRARLVSAQELAAVGDWQWNARTQELSCSEQTREILGITADSFELSLDTLERRVRPEDRERWDAHLEQATAQANAGRLEFEYHIQRPDGRERVIHQVLVARHDPDGALLSLSATLQDISERLELSTRLKKLSEHIPGFIFQYELRPDGSTRFPYVSQGIIDLYGLWPEQVHEDAAAAFSRIHREDIEHHTNGIYASARALRVWNDQYRVQHPERGEIWLEGNATPERLADGGTLWHGYLWEITDRKRAEDQIRELALYDPLTGLANRRLFRDRLEHALATSQRSQRHGALLMMDLDHFKTLNDTQGHDVGDALLVEVGHRVSKEVRAADTVARLGGDEFVVILEALGRDPGKAQLKAMQLATAIQQALHQPYRLMDRGCPYQTSVSIGVSLFHDLSLGADELLRRADIGMFEAKESGRNRVCLFSEQREAEVHSRTSLIQELADALQQGQLMLYYQPQFRPNGSLHGAEALLRWQSPSRGMVPPGDFIPLAEETGLILSIGDWVLDTACRHLSQIQRSGLHDQLSLSVNISPRQFSDPAFLDKVEQALTSHAAPAQRLKLELTESSLFHDMDHAIEILEQLRERGIGIELDDFGTGYSSLSYLKRLPLDTLKLDGSLIADVVTDARDLAILRAAIAMAKTLSLTVIAEGVETDEQRTFLAREGCDLLQGFLLARPMPFDEFNALIERAAP
ncbi:EAL domain-containing protein [Lamprobacter modestohalophilus]|uniref:EAL domain-containing protein n=1 Tax=Lamprobacter modestohalophilus TaxID=1064514 RepID=UPI002ADEC2F7|nr:EAL domain-containing protein [Lamprobacter modestohalophilus]MEA1053290.1 EAL domain-containing protein [Lamprobacter modestohalophilus]